MQILHRWSRLVVSFCILLSNWFFFLGSDLLMDTGFCHLIGQISWLLIVWTRSMRAETRTSFDMSRKPKSKDQTKALNIDSVISLVRFPGY
jgi:hypothetical protein